MVLDSHSAFIQHWQILAALLIANEAINFRLKSSKVGFMCDLHM